MIRGLSVRTPLNELKAVEFEIRNPTDDSLLGIFISSSNGTNLTYDILDPNRFLVVFDEVLRSSHIEDILNTRSLICIQYTNYQALLSDFVRFSYGTRLREILVMSNFDVAGGIYIMSMTMYSEFINFISNGLAKVKKILDKPKYQPLPEGAIVYKLARFSTSGEIDTKTGVGKVLKVLTKYSDEGHYTYEIEFLTSGVSHCPHNHLLPTKDFFDHLLNGKDCYYSTFKSGGLFEESTPFDLLHML